MATEPVVPPIPFVEIKWVVTDGSKVALGQVIAIAVASASMEMPAVNILSPAAGQIHDMVLEYSGDLITEDKTIATIEYAEVESLKQQNREELVRFVEEALGNGAAAGRRRIFGASKADNSGCGCPKFSEGLKIISRTL